MYKILQDSNFTNVLMTSFFENMGSILADDYFLSDQGILIQYFKPIRPFISQSGDDSHVREQFSCFWKKFNCL